MKHSNNPDDYPSFRSFPLFVILVCGLLVSGAGLLLAISKTRLHGKTFANRYGEGGSPVFLNGWGLLMIGLCFCIFPIYHLVKNQRRQKANSGS